MLKASGAMSACRSAADLNGWRTALWFIYLDVIVKSSYSFSQPSAPESDLRCLGRAIRYDRHGNPRRSFSVRLPERSRNGRRQKPTAWLFFHDCPEPVPTRWRDFLG